MRIAICILLALILGSCSSASDDSNGIGPALVGPSPLGHWISASQGAFDVYATVPDGYVAIFADNRLPRMTFTVTNIGNFVLSGSSHDNRTGEIIEHLASGRFTNTSMTGTWKRTYKRAGNGAALAGFSSGFNALKQRHETGTQD